jgi:hypothetical protein
MTTLPATISQGLAVQYWDGLAWQTFGTPGDLGTIKRTRRFGPGPRQAVVAQKWRVVRLGADDLTGGTITLDQIAFQTETGDLSPVKLYNFDFDVDTQRYTLVATAGNIEVYHDDVRQASIPTPYTADQLLAVNKVQELDTFLGFHPEVPPLRITRQGANDQWDSRQAVFTNIPLFDYTGLKAGGVNEVQQITFDSYTAGDTFNITLEDFTTDPIAYSAVGATMAAQLTASLEALDNVGAGGVTVANTATDTYSVTFVGDNAAEDVGQMVPETIHSTSGGVFAATLTQGLPGGEAIISATRGWPACGAFYQQRLYMAGLASQPQTILGSVIGDFFNFDTKGRPTAAALNETLDTDEAVIIQAVYPGRHLQVFTTAAEFYFPTEPIVPPAGIKQTTRRGIQPSTPLGFMDGATVFVTRGGGGLCKFAYDVYQQSYTAPWLNVLAPDLVSGVVDMAFRRALSPKETDQALLVRDDGLLAVMMALLDQNVVGFTRWSTKGLFLAAVADLAGERHLAVQRTFRGITEIYLERVDPDAYTDHETLVPVVGDPVESVALPTYLAGETMTVMIDGLDAGDYVVGADGTLDLPFAALRQVAAGCLFVPLAYTLPLATTQDPRPPVERQMRTGEIAVLLGPTANLNVGPEGGRLWPVPLKRRPKALLDGADAATPFQGWSAVKDIEGFADEECVVLTQLRPGPLSIRQLVVAVDT